MENEKSYLTKIAEMISDKKVENKDGIMYYNKIANATLFIGKHDVKNKTREENYLKKYVCEYGSKIYSKCADLNISDMEYYLHAKDFFEKAAEKNIPAEKMYAVVKEIEKNTKDSTKVCEDDSSLDFEETL
jgi:hypothetical protein